MNNPKNRNTSNQKAYVMDNLEDFHNWTLEDNMELEYEKFQYKQIMERD